MNSTIETKVTITLEMSEAEATWLKGMVQNTQGPNETPYSTEIRKSFWEALVKVLPNVPTTTMRYNPSTPKVKGS